MSNATRYYFPRRRTVRRSFFSFLIGAAINTFTWLDEKTGSFRRLASRQDREFAENLSDSLFFVFDQAGAHKEELPPSECKDKRYFDDARAIVSTTSLRLHFQKVRGQLELQVASLKRPFEWQDVSTLLNWYDMEQGLPRQEYPNFSDVRLGEADEFLKANWTRLCEAVEVQEN